MRKNQANPTTTQTNLQMFERHFTAMHERVLFLPVMTHKHINT